MGEQHQRLLSRFFLFFFYKSDTGVGDARILINPAKIKIAICFPSTLTQVFSFFFFLDLAAVSGQHFSLTSAPLRVPHCKIPSRRYFSVKTRECREEVLRSTGCGDGLGLLPALGICFGG